MIINSLSDGHLEFAPLTLPGGDTLILAGDIAEARTILRHKKGYEDAGNKWLNGKNGKPLFHAWQFFLEECAKYRQIFLICGNHEHYHGRFDKTHNELKAIMPPNVKIFEKDYVIENDIVFMGATLWTSLNNGDPITAHTLKYMMNDYKLIQQHYPDRNLYHKLRPEDTYKVHKDTVQYFKTVLDMHPDKKFVIFTHHMPSFSCINSIYKEDMHMNGGYASNLNEFILDRPQIKIWLSGHSHLRYDFMIGETRLLSNPRGYEGHEDTSNFDPGFSFEI